MIAGRASKRHSKTPKLLPPETTRLRYQHLARALAKSTTHTAIDIISFVVRSPLRIARAEPLRTLDVHGICATMLICDEDVISMP